MLKGKTAIITGGSRGIGRGISIKFAENGAFVGINFVNDVKSAEETLKKVKEKGGDGILLKGDVSNPEDAKKIIDIFVKNEKNIDILVNNAGIYNRSKFEKLTEKNWNKSISVNLSGSFYETKTVLPYMKLGGKIIFLSSQLALKGSLHGADYSSTKAGLLGLMRSLALELSVKKINVNAIAPGTIDTDLLANYTKEMKLKRINEIPLKRLGTPEDIANTCLFLASDMSDYITGEIINVNGGLYIH
jgi:3-oxoacyl-[acyl-carrier protein] reductase